MIATATEQQTVLNIGCGAYKDGFQLPAEWKSFREIRVDVDPSLNPDFQASMTDLSAIPTESVDAIFCRGALEHVYEHEVSIALGEMRRVLKHRGEIILTTVDLDRVMDGYRIYGLNGVAYESKMGPITIRDMIYGHAGEIAAGHKDMAHHTGFSAATLQLAFSKAGFIVDVGAWQNGETVVPYGLAARGVKP